VVKIHLADVLRSLFYGKFAVCLVFLSGFTHIQAQIPQGGRPFPYNMAEGKSIRVVLPLIDVNHAFQNSLSGEALRGKKPFNFAWNHDVDFTPANSGRWSVKESSIRVWRLELKSPGAFAVNIYFGRYRLTKGCSLFAYSPDQRIILGGFNEKNNLESGQLPLAFIPGETVVVELQVPAAVMISENCRSPE